jgi:hypothetical protein
MENSIGSTHYYQSGGQATWKGGNWGPGAGSATGFSGRDCYLTVEGVAVPDVPDLYQLNGGFTGSGFVRIRDCIPGSGDSAPTPGGIVWWDTFAVGAFTPVVLGTGTAGTWTPTTAVGRYSWDEHGEAHIDLTVTGTLSGASGNIAIDGSPLSVANIAGLLPVGNVMLTNVTISSGYANVVPYMAPGSARVQLVEIKTADAENVSPVGNLPGGSFTIRVSMSFPWK